MDNTNYDSKHTGPEIDAAIDRAKAGGEIDKLLAGKAPAGYGLGGNAKFITSGDLNDYKNCGWYAWDEGVSNVPFAYGSCIILNKGSSWIAHQIAVAGYGQNICIRRYLTPTDTWDAWEWVNPPMQPGVEYRTTERYLGLPVYVKLVDLGNYPASGTKTVAHGISNVKSIVSCLGTSSLGYSVNGYQYVDHLYADTANVHIIVNADVSKNQVKVILKYTKTTD